MLSSGPARNLGHRLNDVRVELLAEVRRDLRARYVDLDLVEVLQAQNIVVGESGNDPREEEPQRLEGGADLPGFGLGQRQVEADPVDPAPAQLAQSRAYEVQEVGAVAGHTDGCFAPLRRDIDA